MCGSPRLSERMSRELRTGNFFLKRLTPYHRYKADMDFAFGITYNYRIRLSLLVFPVREYPAVRDRYVLVPHPDTPGEIGLRRAIGSGRGQVRGCCSARES